VIEVKYESVRGSWCSLPAVGSYGVSVWKYIRRGRIFFLSSCDWRWEMGIMFDFGMICGVEIGRSSSVIQFCSVLLVFKTLGW
jgi:hypothetical protein